MNLTFNFIKCRLAFLASLLFISSASNAQGIEFMHNLDSALAKAKSEKKMVFVDFYTSWCAPCKILSTTVFPLPEVGTYYNSNFINCKVQCDDKGAGELVGKKYKINAYPTLMFMDAEGNNIHSMAGAPDSKGLIELGKTALDPNNNQLSLVHEWESGNREHAFLVNYFNTMKKAYRNEKATADFETWFKTLAKKEKAAKNTFDLLALVKSAPFSVPFEYMENNKKDFYKSVGQVTIDSFLASTYLWYFKGIQYTGLINKDLTKFNAEMKKFKAKNYPYYDEYAEFYNVFDAKDNNGKDDINEYMKRGSAFLAKYGKKNDSYTVSLSSMLGNYTGGKDQGLAGIQWMEELLSRKRNPQYFSTYIYILWRNHHWDKALAVCHEWKDYMAREGKATANIERQIEQIKGYKKKYGD